VPGCESLASARDSLSRKSSLLAKRGGPGREAIMMILWW
jgi:hypothetical protein